MGFSAVANWIVSHFLFKVGKETDSVALQADGWHLRADVYTSVGVLVGLALIWIGEWLLPKEWDLHWIDPVAAILVAAMILKEAYTLTVRSARDLMDMTLPADEQAWIGQMLRTFMPAVHGFHRMKTRKAGSNRFIEFHIFVDAMMTVEDAHRLSHEIGGKIEQHFGQTSVTVHVEPCRGDCTLACAGGCLLSDAQRQTLRLAYEQKHS
jgi:cation diffusion facilitator family transporter